VIHHIQYLDSDKIYSDFKKKNSKGNLIPDTLAYHKYLIPVVKKDPGRFAMLCSSHHSFVGRTARWKDVDVIARGFYMILLTKGLSPEEIKKTLTKLLKQ